MRKKIKYAQRWDIPKGYDDYWYFRKYYRHDLPPLTRIQHRDFHTYLPSDILTKVDRVSMAVPAGRRESFLSRKIIEFMFSLSEDIRFYKGKLKGCLKEAYRYFAERGILTREKDGLRHSFKYSQPKIMLTFNV